MILKDDLVEFAETLPQEIELDDILDSIILLNKIENGISQVENGEAYSLEEVKEIVSKW
ncbi:MAG: hypothetical protein KIT33_13590 [Candidatus Kapabacteria bacterium]|nr:hypothetical protein [Ignavibacteriota bacterium]MCW5885998.1 hypothetical protein [Candidatus Kapabacteria bacterium]